MSLFIGALQRDLKDLTTSVFKAIIWQKCLITVWPWTNCITPCTLVSYFKKTKDNNSHLLHRIAEIIKRDSNFKEFITRPDALLDALTQELTRF